MSSLQLQSRIKISSCVYKFFATANLAFVMGKKKHAMCLHEHVAKESVTGIRYFALTRWVDKGFKGMWWWG
jgi:hypothetical protein